MAKNALLAKTVANNNNGPKEYERLFDNQRKYLYDCPWRGFFDCMD